MAAAAISSLRCSWHFSFASWCNFFTWCWVLLGGLRLCEGWVCIVSPLVCWFQSVETLGDNSCQFVDGLVWVTNSGGSGSSHGVVVTMGGFQILRIFISFDKNLGAIIVYSIEVIMVLVHKLCICSHCMYLVIDALFLAFFDNLSAEFLYKFGVVAVYPLSGYFVWGCCLLSK